MNDHFSADSALDLVLEAPRLVELDEADIGAPASAVWERVRHQELASSPIIRALFAIRTLPSKVVGSEVPPFEFRFDRLTSTPEHPGFSVLAERPGQEIVVGAIGKVWQLDIPFVHVEGTAEYDAFREPGFVKVAWALRVIPRHEHACRLEVEVRVDATDDDSWRKFRRYFRVVGPASHLIRKLILADLARELGTPEAEDDARTLAGDEFIPQARSQATHGITVAATPDRIWPWLLQMGAGRAGFYSADMLDNDGIPSARELHSDWTQLRVGQVIPAASGSDEGFEVLQLDPPHHLILGGLFDAETERQLPFGAPRPSRFWHVTWAFVLQPLDAEHTRLTVRARVAFPNSGRFHALWIRPVHHFMQTRQLHELVLRAEGRLPRDGLRDVLDGLSGMARMTAALLAPYRRQSRSHWGIDSEVATREYPGDELIPHPRWSWTHGIEVDAPAPAVWPWLAQIGADRGGFYSYQWLENVIGCNLRNAETIHPEWEIGAGDGLVLHPSMPPLPVVAMERGRYFVVHGRPDEDARAHGKPWVASSWLFFVEAVADNRCRVISRFRSDSSDDLATRLTYGPALVEPIGFAMDRRMLLGIKQRAEVAQRTRPLKSIGTAAAEPTSDRDQ